MITALALFPYFVCLPDVFELFSDPNALVLLAFNIAEGDNTIRLLDIESYSYKAEGSCLKGLSFSLCSKGSISLSVLGNIISLSSWFSSISTSTFMLNFVAVRIFLIPYVSTICLMFKGEFTMLSSTSKKYTNWTPLTSSIVVSSLTCRGYHSDWFRWLTKCGRS